MRTLIDFIYTLLIGVAVAAFVGLGIWTFYSGPKFPEYPTFSGGYSEPSEAEKKKFENQQKRFDQQMKQYQKEEKPYSRNVSAIALGTGLVVFVGGVLLIRKNDIVGEGLALGGVFTEFYAAARGTTTDTKPLVFAAATLVLVMLVVLVLQRAGTLWPAKPRRK